MSKLSNWLKPFSKYLLAAVLLSVPLYPKFPFISIPGTFVSVRLEDLVLFVGGLVALLIIFPKRKAFLEGSINRSIILYLLVGLVSVSSAYFLLQTIPIHIGILHWVRRIEYFLAFFLAFETLRINKDIYSYYLKLISLIVLIAAIYGMGQRYLFWPIIVTQNEEYSKGLALRYVEGGHINATFAGHYDLATFLVLVLPIIIASIFLFKDKLTKIFMTFTLFGGLWLLVNSASRISFLSYIISATLVLFFIKKIKWIPVILIISFLFIGSSTNLIVRYNRVLDVFIQKVQQFNKINYSLVAEVYAASEDTIRRVKESPTPTPTPILEDRSTNIRLAVEWPRAIRAFTKNPLVGTGYSSITLATDNDYLRLLGETGMLGFLAFMLILLRVFYKVLLSFPFHKNLKGEKLALVAGYAAAFPGVLINAFFIDVFEASKFAILFWLITGIVISSLVKKEYE